MREPVLTKDGSHTIVNKDLNVTYHSIHGAIQESRHVFLDAGLHCLTDRSKQQAVAVFEMGFGTGLNAFLTAIDAVERDQAIYYVGVETAPLSTDELNALNYADILGHKELFQGLHQSLWSKDVRLNGFFTLNKMQADILAFAPSRLFDVIYYDAFAPAAQPELWTITIFEKLFAMLNASGVLVTYCSKGDVRRAMQAAGFMVEKLAGPPGKREMLRASKPHSFL